MKEKTELFLDGLGFDCAVQLTKNEVACCQEVLETGNTYQAWRKHIAADSKANPMNMHNMASQWMSKPDIKLYMLWLKSKTAAEMKLSTDLIAKRLAGALTCSLDQFIRPDGSRRRLNEIPVVALGSVKAKMKYNSHGEPTGNIEVELPSTADVINALSKLAAVDADLVNKLKAKVSEKKLKLNRS